MIRQASADDVNFLRALERAAGDPFREVGMASIAEDEPLPLDELLDYQRGGRAWVATDDVDSPVGYLLVDIIDSAAHIEQVSVHPDHARLGLGAALIDVAEVWARDQGFPSLTLMTFADVPWNAPYYARLGFSVIESGKLTPGLVALREREHVLGLTAWPRVAMRRTVS